MCKTIVHVYAHKSKVPVICCMLYDCYNLQSNKGWQLIPAEQSSLTNHNAVSIGDKEESQTFFLCCFIVHLVCTKKALKEILL